MSGVTVPTTMRSISPGAVEAASRAARAALAAMSELVSPAETLRSLMPVREVIHSSDVSTMPSNSRLVTTLAGA